MVKAATLLGFCVTVTQPFLTVLLFNRKMIIQIILQKGRRMVLNAPENDSICFERKRVTTTPGGLYAGNHYFKTA